MFISNPIRKVRTVLLSICLLLALTFIWLPSPSKADCPCTELITLEIPGTIPEPGDPLERPIWIDTEVYVPAGISFCLTATGQVSDGGGYVSGPNGTPGLCGDPFGNPNWYDDVDHIALIGRLRLESDPLSVIRIEDTINEATCPGAGHVGETLEYIALNSGWIELAVNDGDTANNSGSYTVEICTDGVVSSEKTSWGTLKARYQ